MPVEKIASGGELSRFMLSLKSIIAQHLDYETLLFDEIDTGISGEVAFEMALLMLQLSQNIQVISITHLPQVAALGHQHFAITKYIDKGETFVNVRLLTHEERIHEIAKMISGKEITTSAIDQAKHLLSIKTK
jgi:DNA repair protein RecN (Recombination protein N)